MSRSRIWVFGALVVACLSWVGNANATIVQLEAILSGIEQVPPNASPGTGLVLVTVDDVANQLVVDGSWNNLTAPAVAAHIHGLASAGANAAVIFPFSITPGTSGSFHQVGGLSHSLILGLEAGLGYANFHTANFPAGEIRGQLQVIPEPGSVVLLGIGALGLLAAAWRRRQRA